MKLGERHSRPAYVCSGAVCKQPCDENLGCQLERDLVGGQVGGGQSDEVPEGLDGVFAFAPHPQPLAEGHIVNLLGRAACSGFFSCFASQDGGSLAVQQPFLWIQLAKS